MYSAHMISSLKTPTLPSPMSVYVARMQVPPRSNRFQVLAYSYHRPVYSPTRNEGIPAVRGF